MKLFYKSYRQKERNPINRLITPQNAIQRLLCKKETVLVAIDGNCTSGKTTLASQFAEIFEAK